MVLIIQGRKGIIMNHFLKVGENCIVNVNNVEAMIVQNDGTGLLWFVSSEYLPISKKAVDYFTSVSQDLTDEQENENEH